MARPSFAATRTHLPQKLLFKERPLEVRLVQLLGSFIATGAEYALARLEFALCHDDLPAPPTIARPPDASEETLRTIWPQIEHDLEAAVAYAKHLEVPGSRTGADDPSSGRLGRTIKELDQYVRAIRWVLTVTEKQ